MTDTRHAPAFYASSGGRWRDWWSVLHPPYTAWHLSYVVIGACLAPAVDPVRLGATLLAFFLAVGIAAHALDEVHGRPLRTAIPSWQLGIASTASLAGAAALGIVGTIRVGPVLLVFVAVGIALVVGYNLELGGGLIHTDAGFAAAWGAFPVLTAYFAQAERISVAAVFGASAAFALSWAQRTLSTPARLLRRRVRKAQVRLELLDGTTTSENEAALLRPLEAALRALSLAMVALAAALAIARLA